MEKAHFELWENFMREALGFGDRGFQLGEALGLTVIDQGIDEIRLVPGSEFAANRFKSGVALGFFLG